MIIQTPRLPLPVLLLVAACLSACFKDDDGGAGDGTPDGLNGRVRLAGGAAVEATVRAIPVEYRPGAAGADPDRYSATTGAGGVYAFRDIPAGVYNILATRNGLVAFLDSVEVTGMDQSLPTVTLSQPGTLVGQMELQPQHSTLGSVVEVLGTPVFANVDEDGDFKLTGLAPGTYRLRAASDLPDYTPAHLAAAVAAGSADTLEAPIRLPYSGTPHAGLSGRIRDPQGEAAVGAAVWAYPADFVPGDAGADPVPKAIFSSITGAGGIFVMEDVPEGEYNILASKHAWKSFRARVQVTGMSQSLPADTLKPAGVLGGRVIMRHDHPPIAAVVQVMGTPVFATVDEQGDFQLPPLAPGTYRLRAHSTLIDYAPAYREAVITSGTGYLLEQPLEPVYSGAPARLLIGRVWDDRGPAVGVRVWAGPVDYVPGDTAADSVSSAKGTYTAITGAGGIYAFADVPAGRYNILIGNSIYRDSVTVTGAIQALPFETMRKPVPLPGKVLLQPNHSRQTARVQVLGTPIFLDVREDSAFQLPLGPGTYRLRAHTSLPEYTPVFRDIVVPPGSDTSPLTLKPRFLGIPVLVGLSAVPGPDGTVVLSWKRPDYGAVDAYLVYRDPVDSPDSSETPYVRVARTDTAWIDTVYSRAPRVGQYDYADTAYHEQAYRVRILAESGAMGPLFGSVRGKAVPPALPIDTIPPAPDPNPQGP